MLSFKTEGRREILRCMVGSHNYNLNMEDSDKDYKVFVSPTFNDLYDGKIYSYSENGPEYDYSVHDIRKLVGLLWKSNINFIEVLFSDEVVIEQDDNTLESINAIFAKKEQLARMNLPQLLHTCLGMYFTKFKSLGRGTEGTQYLVELYGYDTKQAQHCYRCLDFLERYHATDFKDFKYAIWYSEGPKRDYLLGIKQGIMSLDEFRGMAAAKYRKVTSTLESVYRNQPPDQDLHDWLGDLIKYHINHMLR